MGKLNTLKGLSTKKKLEIEAFIQQAEINKGSKLTPYERAETIRYIRKGYKSSFMKD